MLTVRGKTENKDKIEDKILKKIVINAERGRNKKWMTYRRTRETLAHSRMLDEVFIQRPQCIKMSVSIDEADLRPGGQTCNQDRTLGGWQRKKKQAH